MAGSIRPSLLSQGLDNTSFKYSPLSEEKIRLVKCELDTSGNDLHLRMKRYQRASAPQYYALSYCWGDMAAQKRITLNEQPFNVTGNLYEALIALLAWLGPKHTYWIDAVCINQNDIAERSSQVQQMWRIFSRASRVLSWLGPNDHNTEALFNAWTRAGNEASKVDEAVVERGLASILCRRYFTRTWIIPEIMQARKVVLVCGTSYFTRGAMQTWLDMISQDLRIKHGGLLESHLRRFRGLFNPQTESPFYLNVIIHTYASSECSDPRDKIFAMLSDPTSIALGPALWLKADYSLTVEELWLLVMRQYTELNLRYEWHEISTQSSVFGSYLAGAVGVPYKSEQFGRWLAPQISIAWKPTDCMSTVAVLKVGGVVLVPASVHAVAWAACDQGAELKGETEEGSETT